MDDFNFNLMKELLIFITIGNKSCLLSSWEETPIEFAWISVS